MNIVIKISLHPYEQDSNLKYLVLSFDFFFFFTNVDELARLLWI